MDSGNKVTNIYIDTDTVFRTENVDLVFIVQVPGIMSQPHGRYSLKLIKLTNKLSFEEEKFKI